MISSPPLNQQLNPYSRLQFPSTYQKNTPLSSVGYQYPGMIGNSMYPPYGGGPGYAFPSSTYASSGLPVGLPGHGHNIGLAGLSRAIVGQSGFPRTGPSVFPQEYQARSVGVQQGYSRMEYIPY